MSLVLAQSPSRTYQARHRGHGATSDAVQRELVACYYSLHLNPFDAQIASSPFLCTTTSYFVVTKAHVVTFQFSTGSLVSSRRESFLPRCGCCTSSKDDANDASSLIPNRRRWLVGFVPRLRFVFLPFCFGLHCCEGIRW